MERGGSKSETAAADLQRGRVVSLGVIRRRRGTPKRLAALDLIEREQLRLAAEVETRHSERALWRRESSKARMPADQPNGASDLGR